MRLRLLASLAILPVLLVSPAFAGDDEDDDEKAVEGYAEWHHGQVLVVDGQAVRLRTGGKFKGEGEARSVDSIPLGYEVKAKGERGPQGVLLADEIEAKPNGTALFEREVLQATNNAESSYRRAGRYYVGEGRRRKVVGRLFTSGPDVQRVRRIMDRLVPPYLEPDRIRVYVIDNPEWNAFAMGNYSIYVFSGLLDDMDDDEVAIVLGHELAHATHEHTRRQFKKAMWIQIAAIGVAVAAESMDDRKKRAVVNLVTTLGASIWANGFGRELEDQADRVGLRYAFEGGYDVSVGPRLWHRFARRYGEPGKVANFFFGNHSRATARAQYLEREIALNYSEAAAAAGQRNASNEGDEERRTADAAQRSADVAPDAETDVSGDARALGSTKGHGVKDVKKGMTMDQVKKLLGPPNGEKASGSNVRWTYPDFKVVFENGRVAEVRY